MLADQLLQRTMQNNKSLLLAEARIKRAGLLSLCTRSPSRFMINNGYLQLVPTMWQQLFML